MSSNTDQTLVDYCYKHIKEGIIRGTFAPGEKLRIVQLKSHLNTGPTPIREALSRLMPSGLVDAHSNRGFYVKKISESDIRDLYSTFAKIELLALSDAIDLGDSNWEANILAALHKLSTVEKAPLPIDHDVWLKLNYEFHLSLITACGSKCLLKIREDLYQIFDRYCHLSLLHHENSVSNHHDHCEIANAVIAREKTKALQLTQAHLENSLTQVIDGLKRNQVL